jgi:hypothetical protein
MDRKENVVHRDRQEHCCGRGCTAHGAKDLVFTFGLIIDESSGEELDLTANASVILYKCFQGLSFG